jgi:hypothetical protein
MQPVKLTAERLKKVDTVQKQLAEVSKQLADLADEEENGWTPGNPSSGKSPRVEPLTNLARQAQEGVDILERLYS